MQFRVTSIMEVLDVTQVPMVPPAFIMTLRQLDIPPTSGLPGGGPQIVIPDSTAYEVGSTYDLTLTLVP